MHSNEFSLLIIDYVTFKYPMFVVIFKIVCMKKELLIKNFAIGVFIIQKTIMG